MTKPIGLVIKEIATEKKMKAYWLSEQVGRGRTYAYDTFRRNSMPIEEIEMWAKILQVETSEILSRQRGGKVATDYTDQSPAALRSSANYDLPEYLRKYIQELEDRVAEQSRLITALVGKSEPVLTSAGFAPGAFFKAPSGTNLGTGRILTF
ncbi:hypothetical protein [Siphonobacter aquaeclarae]|uniref:Uncharacterized protein n=1 Tax=Siphonobacter aquaeclarae TaxID=563176 RepID=A0A1G9T8E4_9BACT|nr:hypothetical protein [Siphonobacter aquaeclarae]SDM43890.1 hypothetical protein SAMN04488090_3454 [Siphonobacter aquaeclarae]